MLDNTPLRYWVIIPAAGKGTRMQAELPKQYLQLLGRTVLEHTLSCFAHHPKIAGVMVALAPDDILWPTLRVESATIRTTLGGLERCHSVLNALIALTPDAAEHDWVLVHDAARPCLRRTDIDRMIETLHGGRDGGILATPVRDTLKRCSAAGAIEQTIDRTGLWHALTPQMFRYASLRGALETAVAGGLQVTDEAQAIEFTGAALRVVAGHADNIKITRPEDLVLAELYLRAQGRA